MDLKQLNTFLVLCKFKNFTKTAEHLNYAQSSVTAQIQQMEKELNVCLFERIGKSVYLTREGEKLIPHATKMLSLSSDIVNMYADTETGGHITIGAAESLSIYKLPAIIKEYKKEHPEVELYIKLFESEEMISSLSDNSIDIVFTIEPPIKNPIIKTVFERKEEIGVYATKEHPLAFKEMICAKDFTDVPIILTGKECCYRKLFERALLMQGVSPKIVLETGSVQVIKETALSGLGLCVLPELVVHKEVLNKELIKLNYDNDFHICTQLLYHKDKWISQNLKKFINLTKMVYC
jgi:DNA-binding transcriptional LysR family regulator